MKDKNREVEEREEETDYKVKQLGSDSDKLALALITTYDLVGVSKGAEEAFEQNFQEIQGYNLYTKRTKDLDELFKEIREHSNIKTIDTLILAYHGRPNGIRVNKEERISSESAHELFKGYRKYFSDNPIILLHVCATGGYAGEGKNLAQSIAEALSIDTMAPRYSLANNYSNKRLHGKTIFSLDEFGRARFSYENFALVEYEEEGIKPAKTRIVKRIISKECKEYLADLKKITPDMKIHDGRDAFLYVKRN